jgi:thioredoxin reductase
VRAPYDAIIVGGGPAGLSAALVLGRCRRNVLVCDAGHPRNERSRAMHGYLSRDGIAPSEFAAICRDQLGIYPNVEMRAVEVTSARHEGGLFKLELRDGTAESARTLLLATGIVDELPKIPGFEQIYGRSAHHCPYCDGWERRDQPLAVLGAMSDEVELAIELLQWSKDVILCTNGAAELGPEQRKELARRGIRVVEDEIEALEADGDALRGIRFRSGGFLTRSAVFFSPAQRQRSSLGEQLGCEFCDDHSIQCGENTETCIPGLYAAGNASRGLQLVILAAAEGTQAAFAINEALLATDDPR